MDFTDESFREAISKLVRDEGGVEVVGEDVGGGERRGFKEDDVL